MAWIRTIAEDEATGSVKQQYETAVRRAGRVFNIVKISSLKPEIMHTFINLYLKEVLFILILINITILNTISGKNLWQFSFFFWNISF